LIIKSEFSWKTRNCLDDPKLLNGSVHYLKIAPDTSLIYLKNKTRSLNKRLNDRLMLISLSAAAEELRAIPPPFSLFSFLPTDTISSRSFTVCVGAALFKNWQTVDFLPHSSSRSLFFLLFCFSILSAPHLAFLGSHSHYATLAGTRPYISEYPGSMFSLGPRTVYTDPSVVSSFYSSGSQGGGVYLKQWHHVGQLILQYYIDMYISI